MNRIKYNGNGFTANFIYPDNKVFAFNPNYVEVEVTEGRLDFIDITCNEKKIRSEIYNGHAKCDISGLLHIGFTNPREERTKTVYILCEFNGNEEAFIQTQSITVIWGSISIGERMSSLGIYNYNTANSTYERHVRWFCNLPQRLYLFNNKKFDSIIPTRSKYLYKTLTAEERAKSLVWADAFDDTFKERIIWSDELVMVYLRKDEQKCGYFLRWVDNLGYMQYFCFAHRQYGVKTEKKYEIENEMSFNGMSFGGGRRESKERTESVTCAALNITNEEFKYVKTIVSSPIIDLFIGKDSNDEEIWVPVSVSTGSFSIDTKRTMKDFEITLNLPTSQTQQL